MAKLDDMREIDINELQQRGDAIFYLGLMAARGLKEHGTFTFLVREDGKIAMPNPTYVHIEAGALLVDEGDKLPPYRFVRPVLGSGKPQYVAWRDGTLWEIEFTRQAQTTTGDQDGNSQKDDRQEDGQ